MFFLFPKNLQIFWKPYICLFAKNEKRQKCCKFNTYSIFKPHRQHFVLPPLLRRRPLLSALQTFPPINGGIPLRQWEA